MKRFVLLTNVNQSHNKHYIGQIAEIIERDTISGDNYKCFLVRNINGKKNYWLKDYCIELDHLNNICLLKRS